MLLLGSKLLNLPILSLQTGTKLASTKKAIIDPADLTVVAYEVSSPRLLEKSSYLRVADIREISPIGIIIDSYEELVEADDVIKIEKLIKLDFNLMDIKVINQQKINQGHVIDYVIDSDSLYIKKLRVKRKFLSSLNKTELLVDRTQIVEISKKYIMIKSGINTVKETVKKSEKPADFINPFRSPNPQTQTRN